jgi:hypothetical protein
MDDEGRGRASARKRPDRPTHRGRERARVLDDRSLLAAMAGGDHWAWNEFMERFRPLLLAFARQTGIPEEDWDECVNDLLEDEGLRLTRHGVRLPDHTGLYLKTAVRRKHMRMRRDRACRRRYHEVASDPEALERVVTGLCSEDALTSSGGVTPRLGRSGPVGRLAGAIRRDLSDEEQSMLGWVAERVPHRVIATWLGLDYAVASKRIWRLCRRLRARGVELAGEFPESDREQLFQALGLSESRSGVVVRGASERSERRIDQDELPNVDRSDGAHEPERNHGG